MAYPMEMYEDMFRKKTGAYFTKEEKKYIIDFGDANNMSSSKRIYIQAIYCMKRFVPIIIIRLIIQIKVKKAFKNEEAPESFQILYKDFAEIILLTAMKKYSTNSEK